MPRWQLGRALPSVPGRATALEAPLARTGRSEGWAAGEGGYSPVVSDGAYSADEAVRLSSGWTRGASAGLARVRAGTRDNDSESSVQTLGFDAGRLSGNTFCCGTVGPSLSTERTLEVRRFWRNCKKQKAEQVLDYFYWTRVKNGSEKYLAVWRVTLWQGSFQNPISDENSTQRRCHSCRSHTDHRSPLGGWKTSMKQRLKKKKKTKRRNDHSNTTNSFHAHVLLRSFKIEQVHISELLPDTFCSVLFRNNYRLNATLI